MAETINMLQMKDRDNLCKLLTKSFYIPEPYRGAVIQGILKNANNITPERATELISQSFSPINLLKSKGYKEGQGYAIWRGFFTEWIINVQYNTFVNKEPVLMTIVNPDPTSKCDLLHVIKAGDFIKCVAGPDIKTGQINYALDQYERICKSKYDIPFFDADRNFSEENIQRLTKRQRERFDNLQKQYPRKKIIHPIFSNQDMIHITYDFLHYAAYNELPSQRTTQNTPITKEERKDIFVKAIKGAEVLKNKEKIPTSFIDCKLKLEQERQNTTKNKAKANIETASIKNFDSKNDKVDSIDSKSTNKLQNLKDTVAYKLGKGAIKYAGKFFVEGAKQEIIRNLDSIGRGLSNGLSKIFRGDSRINESKGSNINSMDNRNKGSLVAKEMETSDSHSKQNAVMKEINYPEKRESPGPHWVSEHTRNNGQVKVRAHPRGISDGNDKD
ncbi:TPA: hypothetical protein ACLQU7_005342 [Bacillus tropicus]|uniref:hypothetical protein n=1 Tax=Bacillus cereus group TaxID=86661 RepID=UPI00003CB617|nr:MULTISPECIES: hypothetical protein [Bacillus cereus group]AJI07948.1 hypothetical protein AQ16_5488 [Bacillus cereus G9241]AIY72926.1 hypothetical protein NT98_5679 [Bacillus cereus]EAL16050.1 hypothetical protein protein [Bacillus cereus G9241]KDB42855.1 hypothetical protein DH31_28475 [Bacillus cereus]QPS53514.1 hypothetical protein I6G54_28410 [Bacillus tropicus]